MEYKPGNVSDHAERAPDRRVLHGSLSKNLLSILSFFIGFLGWSTRWTLATVFFLLVMAGSAYYVFNQAVKGSSYVQVPDVVGLPITQASNLLAEAGLEIGTQKQVINEQLPEYHVLQQRPSPQTVIRTGRKVNLTISAGREFEDTPRLVGKNLEAALAEIKSTRMVAGAIARIPNNAPRDTILAQDPEIERAVYSGTEIHLLVSDGPGSIPIFMPDVINQSLESAQLILAALNVNIIPYDVERPGADYEVVLAQNPDAGTTLSENQDVTIDVRLLPTSFLPNARRKVSVNYNVPSNVAQAQVRVTMINESGGREVIYPLPENFVDGRPPKHAGGTGILFPEIAFTNETTVEFYINGLLHRSYYFEGKNEPIITDTNVSNVTDTPDPQETFTPQLPVQKKRRRFRFND